MNTRAFPETGPRALACILKPVDLQGDLGRTTGIQFMYKHALDLAVGVLLHATCCLIHLAYVRVVMLLVCCRGRETVAGVHAFVVSLSEVESSQRHYA